MVIDTIALSFPGIIVPKRDLMRGTLCHFLLSTGNSYLNLFHMWSDTCDNLTYSLTYRWCWVRTVRPSCQIQWPSCRGTGPSLQSWLWTHEVWPVLFWERLCRTEPVLRTARAEARQNCCPGDKTPSARARTHSGSSARGRRCWIRSRSATPLWCCGSPKNDRLDLCNEASA